MTQATPSGWGGGGWGSAPWGTGTPELTLESALAVRENVVRLTFSTAPQFTRLGTPHDAADPRRYSVVAVSGVGLDGEPVRPVLPVAVAAAVAGGGGRLVDVTVDRPFTAWPSVYRAVAVNLVASVGGAFLAAGSSTRFTGLRAGLSPPTFDSLVASRDILSPQSVRDLEGSGVSGDPSLLLGTLPSDGSGDLATSTPLASYRGRVYRRATSVLSGFAHLPGYGAGAMAGVKLPSRQGFRDRVASRIEEQVRLEPETVSCTVTVVSSGSVVIYRLRARARFGVASIDVQER